MTEKELMEQICQLGKLHLEGNIVPPSWYQHLKYPGGKPYHIAITLLSEIVYWFRPRMVRDEHSGDFLGWAKKFKGDGIQRSYAAWGAPFGFTKRESADAIKYLVAEGLITTDIRDVTLPDGTLRPNVVVVTSVDPARLSTITYSRRGGHTPGGTTPTGYTVPTEEVVPSNVLPPAGYNVATEEVIPGDDGPSTGWASEGDTPERTCLETKKEIILETNLENSHQPGLEAKSASVAPTGGATEYLQETKLPTPPEPVTPAVTTDTTPAPVSYPALLIKPKSRRAVLELGQRPGRDDLSYPNVASVCSWTARVWKLGLVADVPTEQERAMHELLAALEATLAAIRERALREKQLTFTQVLDDYLGQDEALRAMLREAHAPPQRLALFTSAILEVYEQWDDAPSATDRSALRAHLGDEAA